MLKNHFDPSNSLGAALQKAAAMALRAQEGAARGGRGHVDQFLSTLAERYGRALREAFLLYEGPLRIGDETYEACITPHYIGTGYVPIHTVMLLCKDGRLFHFHIEPFFSENTLKMLGSRVFQTLLEKGLAKARRGTGMHYIQARFLPADFRPARGMLRRRRGSKTGRVMFIPKRALALKLGISKANFIEYILNSVMGADEGKRGALVAASPQGRETKDQEIREQMELVLEGQWDALHRDVSRQRNAMIERFYARLDPRALQILKATGDYRTATYNTLLEDASDATFGFIRAAVAVARRTGMEWRFFGPRPLREMVRAARVNGNWNGAMKHAFHLHPGIVEKIARTLDPDSPGFFRLPALMIRRLFVTDFFRPAHARIFSAEPRLPWPQDKADWESFDWLVRLTQRGTNGYGEKNYRHIALSLLSLQRSLPGAKNWTDLIEPVFGEKNPEQQVDHAGDFFKSFLHKVVLPALASRYRNKDDGTDPDVAKFNSTYVGRVAKRHVTRSFNLYHRIRASNYFHSPAVHFGERLASLGVSSDASWPALTQAAVVDGIHFIPLTSAQDLRAEADTAKHCVWSYTHRCFFLNSHIYSLRDDQGNYIGTLELHDDTRSGYKFNDKPDIRFIRINQILGKENAALPPEVVSIAKDFVGKIKSGEIPHALPAVVEAKNSIFKFQNALARGLKEWEVGLLELAEFDWRDPEKCQAVLGAYLPCLPEPLRRQCHTPEDVIRIFGLDKMMRDMGYERIGAARGAASRPRSQGPVRAP